MAKDSNVTAVEDKIHPTDSVRSSESHKQEPPAITATRFVVENPDVAVAAGAGLIVAGVVLATLRS